MTVPRLSSVKAVVFEYESDRAVEPVLETFRMMVNHAVSVGMRQGIRGRFKLIRTVYGDFNRYGLHTHYTLNACEVASAILKNHKRNHRTPVARRLFLKLDNQTYALRGETLRIPVKPREFLNLTLRVSKYQRRFLQDPSLKRGSITLTDRKAILTFEKPASRLAEHDSVLAFDTNELSLDGAFSDETEIRKIRVDLREIARLRACHFERRRRIQTRLAKCRRRLRAKLAADRDRERRRIDAVLHSVAKEKVNFAKEKNAKIVLEDLKGIRASMNKRVKKRNPHNGKIQPISIRPKFLKRRLNSWPFRRLHQFIEYKAAWEGVPAAYVPARNTSRTCPRCGCLQTGRKGEQDPKMWQVFQCPECGWRCDRHLNAALNLLRTEDEGRWFSPDRRLNEVMTTKRAYEEEGTPRPHATELPEPMHKPFLFPQYRWEPL